MVTGIVSLSGYLVRNDIYAKHKEQTNMASFCLLRAKPIVPWWQIKTSLCGWFTNIFY
jgi:hypothetical protein